jgi:hypothetical protein
MTRRRLWLALAFALALVGPALAEMIPEDVRGQINAVLAERRFENDRRLESLEKQLFVMQDNFKFLIAEKEKLREAELVGVRNTLDERTKHFDLALTDLKAQLVTSLVTMKDQLAASILAAKEAITAANSAQQDSVRAAFASAKEAVDKAASATEKRFDSVNEFRGQLKDQQLLLMPRAEAEVKVKGVSDAVAALQVRMDQQTGRGDGAATLWSILVAVGGLLIGALSVAAAFARVRGASHDPMLDRAGLEVELSRMRAAISSEIDGLGVRIGRIEGLPNGRP